MMHQMNLFHLLYLIIWKLTDVTGVCNLPDGIEMCMPGDNVEMTVELIHPVAMEQGLTDNLETLELVTAIKKFISS